MSFSEVKKHIDNARQILVGVVPNPTSQIDQITNALIYKFMDDMDQEAIKIGGKATFFVGDLAKYSWTQIMAKKGHQEKMNFYIEGFIKIAEAKNIPPLFRNILKSAYLPYRQPETLSLFLKEINHFDYSHPEELGNAYEYLLSIMSSQGDAGQFRTPRHIIDFMVDVIDPKKNETILDPACGTAGFLISSYKHILESNNKGNKKLSPQEKKEIMGNFEGYDIDPAMTRIAQVNMYLHQFKTPKIFQYDSLSSEEKWNDKFDIILANPPFMSPKGGIKPHKKFGVESSRSEVLFVDYIMNHLTPKGRSAIIVPEGIIFQSGTSYKDLRKNLINEGLYAVASLPSGVFNPYSGVKTSILFLDKELAKNNSEILFIKIENDGLHLGAQRRAIDKNDLPKAAEILKAFKKGKKIEDKIIAYVEKSEIAKNGAKDKDYNLSAARYVAAVDCSNAKWPIVELGKVCKTSSGGTPLKSKGEYYENGSIPWLRSGEVSQGFITKSEMFITELGLKNSSAKIFPINTVLVAMYGATAGQVGILKFKSSTNQAVCGILPNEELIPEFLFWVLKSQREVMTLQAGGGAQPNISQNIIQKLLIPLPPLDIQEQIVAELNNCQNIITGARQIVANWKPKIDIDPSWPVVRLEDVCDGFQYGTSEKSLDEGDIVCLRMGNIQSGEIDWNNLKYASDADNIEKYLLSDKDVLFNRTNSPDLVGKTAIFRGARKAIFAGYLIRVLYKKNKLLGDYLNYSLNSEAAKEFCLKNKTDGVSQSNINAKLLGKFELPLPPLKRQIQIVEQIESERQSVESAKKLIEIYEQKTKAIIAKLWSE